MRGLLAYWSKMAYNQRPEETGGGQRPRDELGDDYKS